MCAPGDISDMWQTSFTSLKRRQDESRLSRMRRHRACCWSGSVGRIRAGHSTKKIARNEKYRKKVKQETGGKKLSLMLNIIYWFYSF